ncbi:MAG: hypothetical protein AAF720_05545 [Pseudomonadota bacterium]
MFERLQFWMLIAAFFVVLGCGKTIAESEQATSSESKIIGGSEILNETDTDPVQGVSKEIAQALTRPPQAMIQTKYDVNARRGRILFVTKGCVLCHAANDVGGRAAPAFEPRQAPSGSLPNTVDPLIFSSRMWSGAAAMVSLQRLELGYQIELDPQDLADLAAFAASPEEQKLLTLKSLPVGFENWFVNGRFWDNEEWGEYLERGTFPDLGEYGENSGVYFDKP